MPMLVMGIREMGMGMHHRFMPVPMAVLGPHRYRKIMPMLVVFIMGMLMLMFQCTMRVFVGMIFCQMQPDACRHQQPRYQQWHCDGFAQQHNG
jgi:hypothetical protein